MNALLGHPDVVEAIKHEIRQSPECAIPFKEYMRLCLYHEPHGYYRSERVKIGKDGDFYTSSSIGTWMGEMLAAYIVKQYPIEAVRPDRLRLVEWGGGSGRLALHLLNELQRYQPLLYERLSYTVIESSEFHRELQLAALEPHRSRLIFEAGESWLAEDPQDDVIVIANELLDAFPVHRIRFSNGFEESFVVWDEAGQAFHEDWRPLASTPLLDYLGQLNVQWVQGQIAEVNLDGDAWIQSLGNRIRSGQLLLIDYGDITEELFGSHRLRGTLMCYRKHQAYDNPFIYQGEQDITAHVNFSACMHRAMLSGFQTCVLQTQREFLIEQGILQKLQDHLDPNPFSEAAKRNRTIRQLLLSEQMSELFKVMIAHKKR